MDALSLRPSSPSVGQMRDMGDTIWPMTGDESPADVRHRQARGTMLLCTPRPGQGSAARFPASGPEKGKARKVPCQCVRMSVSVWLELARLDTTDEDWISRRTVTAELNK